MTLETHPPGNLALETPTRLCRVSAQVGLRLSEGEAARLTAYGALLERWNRRINLTASRKLEDILERQVLDCLMADLLPWPAFSSPDGKNVEVVDIGSGAGLPGLIMALRHPDFRVTTLERTGKKVSFQQEAVRLLGLANVRVLQEDARGHGTGTGRGRYAIALARGFADLAGTLTLAAELLCRGGILRTFKGRKLSKELAEVPPALRMRFDPNVVEHPYEVPGSSVAGVLVQFKRI